MTPNNHQKKQPTPEKSPEKSNTGSAVEFNHIENVIAVMSGKGGVGKSFVTGLLASSLAKKGYQVGILDADITGPSIPMLFGLRGPVEPGDHGILPLQSSSGIKIISMNLLLPREDQPIIWRGPLISSAIKQLWGDVMWGNLDYLLIDLPPGTSDAALTIMQSLPLKGVLMVTTPQGLAAMIVNKAVHMAQEVGVPVTGIVENMAYYRCPDTGKQHFIFGPCHSDAVARAASAPVMAQIPIDPMVAELCDSGKIEQAVVDESEALFTAFVKKVPVAGKPIPLQDSQSGYDTSPTRHTVDPTMALPVIQDDASHDQSFAGKGYSEKARRLIQSKENLGCFETPDARAKFKGWCGDSMQIDLLLAGDVIREARFMTDGCGATIAAGSMVTTLARSKSLTEAMQIMPEDVLTALDGLPEDHKHCAELAVNTLRETIKTALENSKGKS
ncbi:MAG: P-loop NTPase [Anaerolineales bacterium]|nr:P-loop NTPase [Anaerolineales bacterium]